MPSEEPRKSGNGRIAVKIIDRAGSEKNVFIYTSEVAPEPGVVFGIMEGESDPRMHQYERLYFASQLDLLKAGYALIPPSNKIIVSPEKFIINVPSTLTSCCAHA